MPLEEYNNNNNNNNSNNNNNMNVIIRIENLILGFFLVVDFFMILKCNQTP